MKKPNIPAFILGVLLCSSTFSQQVDFSKFISETQKSNSEVGSVSIAWWIPIEFWQITLSAEPSISEAQMEDFLQTLRPYMIFAVIDGKMGPLGGINFTPSDSIANSIELIDDHGKVYIPIGMDDLSSDVQNLLLVFKPIVKNMMGQLGENMNFYVFSDVKEKNKRVADPLDQGNIQLNFINKEYKWKLPLSSLLPPLKCPVDNEPMDGTWNYCPWHGTKLVK